MNRPKINTMDIDSSYPQGNLITMLLKGGEVGGNMGLDQNP
jgi:hypothetical protein